MTAVSTASERERSYDQIGVRDNNRRRRAGIAAMVSAAYHLRFLEALPGIRVKAAEGEPGAVEITVRTPPGLPPALSGDQTEGMGMGGLDRAPPGWTRCLLNEVPSYWPGAKVFRGRVEEEWPEGLPPGESRPADMQWGRKVGRRAERRIADDVFSSLYGHLRDDLGRAAKPLPSAVVPRAERWTATSSLIIRHPEAPAVRLSDLSGEFPLHSHSDVVSDLLPRGGIIACEDAVGGLAAGVRVDYARFPRRRRIRLAVDYSWAVTAPEAFRLFTVG